jgi:hypothetical protein
MSNEQLRQLFHGSGLSGGRRHQARHPARHPARHGMGLVGGRRHPALNVLFNALKGTQARGLVGGRRHFSRHGKGLVGGVGPSELGKKRASQSPWLMFIKDYKAQHGKNSPLKVISQAYRSVRSLAPPRERKTARVYHRKQNEPTAKQVKDKARELGLNLHYTTKDADGKKRKRAVTKKQLLHQIKQYEYTVSQYPEEEQYPLPSTPAPYTVTEHEPARFKPTLAYYKTIAKQYGVPLTYKGDDGKRRPYTKAELANMLDPMLEPAETLEEYF